MNTTTKAVRDALGTPIKNGPTLPRPKGSRTWGGKTIATPVVVTVQPLGRCDAPRCGAEAAGEQGMLAHALLHGGAAVYSVVR